MFLIASFIPFLLLSGLSWYNYQKNINDNTLSYVKQLMSTSAAKSDDFFHKLTRYYYSVYSAGLPSHMPKLGTKSMDEVKAKLSLNQVLAELQIFYNLPPELYISIVSESGELLYQNNNVYDMDYSFSASEYFRQFIHSDRTTAVFPSQASPDSRSGSDTGAIYLSYALKIKTDNVTSQESVFLIDFNASQIDTILNPLMLGEDSCLFLTYGNQVIYSIHNEKFDFGGIRQFLNAQTQQPLFFQQHIENQECLIGTYPLSSTEMSILSVNTLSSVYKDAPDLISFTLILSLLSMLLSLLLACYFSYRLTKPIQVLKRVTNQVSGGNLNVQVPPLTNDEIGELGICVNQMLDHIQTLIQEKYEYQLREKEFQIKTLQSQIHPHFLYNTLETISAIADNEGVDTISAIALNLADLYRYSINSSDKLVPLSEELKNVQNYLNIMKIRYTDRLETHFQVDERVLNTPIMKLTLQPIIENAIYHGLENIRTKGLLSIAIEQEGSAVKIVISDNGAGMSHQQLNALKSQLNADSLDDAFSRTRHIGLGNVYYRLKLRFGDSCRMEIDSMPGRGTSVLILLPLPNDPL